MEIFPRGEDRLWNEPVLDGYVDHQEFAPDPVLFRHWVEHVRDLTGSVYGRRMYEVMRYWDEDDPEWDAERRDFAAAWWSQPKWVASRSLKSVGSNATLVEDDLEAVIRGLKAPLVGEIAVAGPDLARSLTDLGLSMSIDSTSTPSLQCCEPAENPRALDAPSDYSQPVLRAAGLHGVW